MLFNSIMTLISGGNVNLTLIIAQIVSILFVIIFILPLHEYAHALIAYKLGDPTPKYDKRLTLNPLASVDPFGSLALLLFGYGWAKPVQVNARNFKNPKRDMAIVAAAGPISNLLAAFVGQLILNICLVTVTSVNVLNILYIFFSTYITINVSLAAFNLIPIPPLDGSRIVAAFLSDRAMYQYYSYQRYFVMIFFVLMFTGILGVPLGIIRDAFTTGIEFVAGLPFMFFN